MNDTKYTECFPRGLKKNFQHNFVPVGSDYWKLSGGGVGAIEFFDKSVSYQVILCTNCGETREIIAKDHRKTSQ